MNFSRILGAATLVLALCGPAGAANVFYGADGSPFDGAMQMWLNGSGNAVPASASNPLPMTCISGCSGSSSASARNFPGCTVGVSSAQCLAAATATTFVQIQNTSASATVACRWGGTAALNTNTSVQLAAGQGASWGPNTGGIPNEALNCIASVATTPLYLEWN